MSESADVRDKQCSEQIHRFMISAPRPDIDLIGRLQEITEEGRVRIRSLVYDNHDGKHTALIVCESRLPWAALAAMLSHVNKDGERVSINVMGA